MVDPAPGVLLIAHPLLTDPNFKRTVVLLCEHDDEAGSFGLVLNEPFHKRMDEMIVGFEAFQTPLYHGGPVQPNTLHVLHQNGSLIEGSVEIVDGLFWGGSADLVRVAVEKEIEALDTFRFFIGYSGWGEGQLQLELEEGAWVAHPVQARHIFDIESDRLWRSVLREMGGSYAILANFPEDPRMN